MFHVARKTLPESLTVLRLAKTACWLLNIQGGNYKVIPACQNVSLFSGAPSLSHINFSLTVTKRTFLHLV